MKNGISLLQFPLSSSAEVTILKSFSFFFFNLCLYFKEYAWGALAQPICLRHLLTHTIVDEDLKVIASLFNLFSFFLSIANFSYTSAYSFSVQISDNLPVLFSYSKLGWLLLGLLNSCHLGILSLFLQCWISCFLEFTFSSFLVSTLTHSSVVETLTTQLLVLTGKEF